MANEVEASELAVAKEVLANEENSKDDSSLTKGVPAGEIIAEGSIKNGKEVKADIKTEAEAMVEENRRQGSDLTHMEETVTEKLAEPKEVLNLAEDSEIVTEPGLKAVNEEIGEETKPEPTSEPLATGEEKPSDELTTGTEPVPSDEPVDTAEVKPGDKITPGTEPAETGEPKATDKLTPKTEPASGDKPEATVDLKPDDEIPAEAELIITGETHVADEITPETKPGSSGEVVETAEPKSGDELIPGIESVVITEVKPGDEVAKEAESVAPGEVKSGDEVTTGTEPGASYEPAASDKPDLNRELSAGLEQEPNDEITHDLELGHIEELPGPEPEPDDELSPDSEDEGKEVVQDLDNNEEKVEKPLDDDQDRRNPQYIPKGGAFYEHDNRTSLEDVENKDPQDNEKKKKSWKESKDSEEWLHDCYNESEQQPKSTAEIIQTYGYDIRRDDAPPRARRRRKYGRGPEKYERSWEDEQAYQMKQNNIGRRGKKKLFGKDEFPPLPNHKFDSSVSKPVHKPSIRKKEEGGSKSMNVKLNGNEKSQTTTQASRSSHTGNHNSQHNFTSNRKVYSTTNKKINDNDIKPFRTDENKWKTPFKHGRQDDFPKPIKTQSVRPTDPPFRRNIETNKTSIKEPHVSQIADGMNQMTFINKQTDIRDVRQKANDHEESKINEPEVDNPVSRQNPKRYSKIRKGFTGMFPTEEVSELDQPDIHNIQQEQQKSQHLSMTQPLNMQNVMKRYAGTYANLSNCVSDFVPGSSSYLQARPIISGIPQQALSPQGIHQQALSPQGIPQQALSPQVPGLTPIELQQNPLGQTNFVPQPMYVDAHFPSEIMSPFSGYSPYSGNQTGDVYQPSRGITYYNTECQTSGQKRPPPRRQNAAIPIVRPSKQH